MQFMLETPVLLVVFNRPEYTQKVFGEIRQARPKQLFIAADGPRESRPDDLENCRQVREIVSRVDWPCEVKTLFREKNLGFRDAERLAFDWFFANVEAGIILEDDGLPHPSFFRFASEMLEQYKDEPKIMMITGGNFMPEVKIEDSYFFSKHFSIWGWASWRRAWQKYNFEMSSWPKSKNKKKLEAFYYQKYMVEYCKQMFDEIRFAPEPKTWDTQWLYACIMNNGLCITPSVNLVSNIGIQGTHSTGNNHHLPTMDIYAQTLKQPEVITVNNDYDDAMFERNFHPDVLKMQPIEKIKRKIISVLVRYESLKNLYHRLRGRHV